MQCWLCNLLHCKNDSGNLSYALVSYRLCSYILLDTIFSHIQEFFKGKKVAFAPLKSFCPLELGLNNELALR